MITSQDEREQLAELNLIAGKRAKASSAYASALNYLIAGAALLADDCWERRPELIFALELHRAECEFLTGELATAEARLTMLSSRAANAIDQATVACLRVDLYTTLDRSDRAVDVCLAYLRHLGIEWSPHPPEEQARREYERIWSLLGSRAIEELVDLPLMSDALSLATHGCADQGRAGGPVYRREFAFARNLPDGESQSRARQLRRIVLRLCVPWHGRRTALR